MPIIIGAYMISARIFLFVGLLSLHCPFCLALDSADSARANAEIMQEAFVQGDLNTFVQYTNPKLVEKMGGKAKLIERITQGRSDMKKQGVDFLSVQVGSSTAAGSNSLQDFVIVPMTLAMKVPDGKMTQRTYLLGVSEDRKKTWTFVDTAQADVTKLKILFPDLPEALKIPPREKPVLERN